VQPPPRPSGAQRLTAEGAVGAQRLTAEGAVGAQRLTAERAVGAQRLTAEPSVSAPQQVMLIIESGPSVPMCVVFLAQATLNRLGQYYFTACTANVYHG